MKNKKNRLILGLVALVLVLGVGYAVVTGTDLFLNGTANVTSTELNVVYKGSTTGSGNGTTSLNMTSKTAGRTNLKVTNVSETEKVATFKVENLEETGDTISFTYTIENLETDIAATTTIGSISNSKSDFFTVTATIGGGSSTTIAANGSAEVTVTVTLSKKPIQAADSETTISIPITAEPAES